MRKPYGEIPGEKELKDLSEVEDLEGYDLAFIGFPINAFGPNPAAKEFLESQASGKRLVIFITHGAEADSPDVPEWVEKCRAAATGADIVGVFNCQGEVAPMVNDFLLKADDPMLNEFGKRGPSTKGQPDEAALERARGFAREIVGKL